MRTRNPSIRPIFGAIIVAALGYNDWNLYHKLMNLRLLETGAQARQRFERQIAGINHEADLWESKADALAAGHGKTGAAGAKSEDSAGSPQQLANEVRNELVAAWIDRVYGPLFKRLALSPDDLAKLKQQITEKRQAILDAIDAAHTQGITDPAGLRDAILEAVKGPNAETQALLGDDNYNLYRIYQASLPARSTLADFTAGLPPGAELTPDQTTALIRIIAQGQDPSGRAASIVENLLTNAPTAVTAKDVTAATSLLSPAQLSVLQSLQQQAVLHRDLLRLLYP